MQPGIRQKLAAAILAASIVATAGAAIATQFGFRRSFMDYLNEQGLARLQTLAPGVAQLYQEPGGWEALRQHPKRWFMLVGIPGGPGPDTPTEMPAGEKSFAPANIDPTGTAMRVALADANRHFLIGYPNYPPDAPHVPVEHAGKVVGWLYLAPLAQASSEAEQRFQRRQLLLTWGIGGVAILGAAALAALLARAFLTPIQAIAQAARQLATGDLSVRVVPGSRDEIGQLAADVNLLAGSLERNESARRHLMADISHEFRTPLSVLRAEIEALEDGVRQPGDGSYRSLLAEVAILNKLVDDVHELSIADLGAFSYRHEPVDVAGILSASVHAFEARFAQRGLRQQLRVDARPAIVMGDEGRLQQLFSNLLENSARHTDAGGEVRVELATAGEQVCVTFDDSAPGVPPDVLHRLFERFFRVDASRSRQTGGSGLGMAICRGIVEAHGGTIRASASELGGLRVSVSLPLAGQRPASGDGRG